MLQPDERRWCRFLWWLALAHVAGGLALPFLALGTPLLDEVAAQAGFGTLGLALFGPTVASWGALMAFLVRYGVERRAPWACEAIIVGTLVWVPVDFMLCLVHGVWPGVVADALMAPALLAPALVLRSRFS